MNRLLLTILVIFICANTFADNGKRGTVFLLGNADYINKDDQLKSPIENVKELTNAFEHLDLQVCDYTDLATAEIIEKKVEYFVEEVKKGIEKKKDYAAIVYYNGHGLSYTSTNGDTQNYIVPTQAVIRAPSNITQQCYSIKTIYDKLIEANCINIVFIIDACRTMKGTPKNGTILELFPGVWTMYSASPGHTANDGKKGKTSPFCDAFIEALNTSNINDIGSFGVEVTKILFNNSQPEPNIQAQGYISFVFNPGVVVPPTTGGVEDNNKHPFSLKHLNPISKNNTWLDWTLLGVGVSSAVVFFYYGIDQQQIKNSISKNAYSYDELYLDERKRGKSDAKKCKQMLFVMAASYISQTVHHYYVDKKIGNNMGNKNTGLLFYPSITPESTSLNLAFTF